MAENLESGVESSANIAPAHNPVQRGKDDIGGCGKGQRHLPIRIPCIYYWLGDQIHLENILVELGLSESLTY